MFIEGRVLTLMQKTLALLSDDVRTTLKLYEETGIPFYWLKKFRGNEFANPSVNRVQFLYEHLTQQKLDV